MRIECDDAQLGVFGADVVGRRAAVNVDSGAKEHSDVELVAGGGGERGVRFAPALREGRKVRVCGALQRERRALVHVQRCSARRVCDSTL